MPISPQERKFFLVQSDIFVECQTGANWKGYRRELSTLYLTTDRTHDNLPRQANLTTLYRHSNSMFKAKNNLLPKYLQDLFNLQGEGEKRYNLRNSDFIVPCFNTIAYGKHSLSYLGPFLRSKLTNKERDMNRLNAF